MFKKILMANDGSEGAARALSAAIKLAKEHGAELHMISVEELPRFPASVDEVIEEKAEANHVYEAVMSRAVAQAQASGVKLMPHVVGWTSGFEHRRIHRAGRLRPACDRLYGPHRAL